MKRAPSFADLLRQGEIDADARAGLRAQRLRALVPLGVVAGLVLLWSCTAPIAGAVVAPAQLKVELDRKTIRHREGGIVRRILVRNGRKVRAGEALLVVGDVGSDAELSLLQDQLLAARVRAARANAEAALQPRFVPSGELAGDTAAQAHIARETALFSARRRTLDEQVASLQVQIREAGAQAQALSRQIEAGEASTRLAAEELAMNERLVADRLVEHARVLQLRRVEADYRSRLGEAQGELALARQRAGELGARIAQARNQYQSQAADEVKDASAMIRELEERLRPSRDQAERQFVRSPVDGVVMSMRVAAAGEVVGAGDPLLDIVPSQEKLVVEARIRPQDINSVRENAPAEVRLTSFDANTTPLLPARVVFVSPDRVTDQDSGEAWFVANIEVDASGLEHHPEIQLRAGMPAELFVTTSERTLFGYLAKPFTAFTDRALREP
jgi:HlyD family type I secretion membrane fusion protein